MHRKREYYVDMDRRILHDVFHAVTGFWIDPRTTSTYKSNGYIAFQGW